jgi:malonate transporter and related proteins
MIRLTEADRYKIIRLMHRNVMAKHSMDMLYFTGLVAPIFAVIAAGYFANRRGLLQPAGLAALTGFTYWLALPALLFGSIAELDSTGLLVASEIYLAACLIVFGLSVLARRFLLRGSLPESAVFGLNATYGNVIYLGTPVVSAVFGAKGVALILAIIAFHSGVLLPLAACLIEIGVPKQGGVAIVLRNTVSGMVRNPILMSIFLGFAWHGIHLPMPGPLHDLLAMLGRAATPLALFSLGASLPTFDRGWPTVREAAFTTVIKLSILPVCVGVLAHVMGLSGLPWKVAVVTAAMPTGANAFMLARRATEFSAVSASTVVITTTLSLGSIAGLLSWLR